MLATRSGFLAWSHFLLKTGSPLFRKMLRYPRRLLRGLRRAARAALAFRRGSRRSRAARRLCVGRRRWSGVAAVLDHAQARDVLQVLIVGLGKGMSAGAVGDEKDFLGARRVGGGLDRCAAGIGDRPRRQALDDIGVVGRGLGDVGLA